VLLHSTIGVFVIKKIVAEQPQEECFPRSGGVVCVHTITSYDILSDKVELQKKSGLSFFP
jgi:hypothetical protein